MDPMKSNAEIKDLMKTDSIDQWNGPDPGTVTVATQTEDLKIRSLETIPQPRKFARPKTTYQQQQKWPDMNLDVTNETDKCTTRNKACQTIKTGVKRLSTDSQMDNLRAVMYQRRKMAIDMDRAHLEKLMETINADPPPPWHEASLLWLEVDKLENRIEEFDKGKTP
ncbi:uncharacterized protein [Drosophila virilis]|uniref:Uncharacterized protein n=1 Tax=Drosophila virilis TaxID=7244 RepID=B4M3L1_DROVI|nr:uncharacterized protein LOC6631777 [Drosophila virilis]XP_032294783.1 uncharacterized protein LOC116651820 [Drosophila virilis]EDW65386.1 uncharacterized protein Dvir_GJ19228 [Drosophila virilis]